MTKLADLSQWHKVPELRRRVFFTMALMAVYRMGVFITTPGVDRNAMRQFVSSKGDTVLIGRYAGTEISIEGEEHIILREDDVLAIVE